MAKRDKKSRKKKGRAHNKRSSESSSRRKKGRSKRSKSKTSFKYKRRGTEAWKKRAEQSGYNNRSIVKGDITQYRPKDGDNLIRILPPTFDDAEHYGYELWVRYGIGPDQDSFLDLNKMLGQPDPIEEERMEAMQDNDKDYADKLQSKKRVGVYLIDRDEEDKGIQFWSMPWTMDADITTLAVDKRTGEVLDIDDPEDGYDIEFTKTGKGIKTQYGGLGIARKSSPLDNDEALEAAIETPLPEALQYYDYDEIAKCFSAGGGYDDDEEEDEDEDDRPRKRKSKGKGKSKKSKRRKYDDGDDGEDEEDEDDSVEVTWADVQEMDFDELADLVDDQDLDLDSDIDEDDEDEWEELRDDICEELGLKKPKKRKAKKSEKDKLRKRRRKNK